MLMREKLAGRASLVRDDFPEGMCPLFFPILTSHKRQAARALQERGVSAVEFWNYGDREAGRFVSSDASFLREHVLELPIHQDVTLEQVEYVADQVLKLKLRMEGRV